MKKILSLVIAIALCLSLSLPVFANDTGISSLTTTVVSGFGPYCQRTMVIKSDGSLWMWGGFVTPHIEKNGGMDTGYKSKPVEIMTDVISVSCSDGEHCAAIKKDGSLWMWGNNDYGQLGNNQQGDTIFNSQIYQFSPIKVMDEVVAVSCGNRHTAVIKTDSSLWLFGSNEYGQIGNNYVGDATRDPTLYKDNPYPIQTVPVKVMDEVIAVSCGGEYTAAVKKDGTLWTWGKNQYGELGNGQRSYANAVIDKTKDKHTPQKIMDDVMFICCADSYYTNKTSFAIKTDGTLWKWGRDSLTPSQIAEDVSFVSPGYMIKTDGTLWSIDDPSTKIMDNVCSVTGIRSIFALTNDGDLFGWGKVEYLGNDKGIGDSTNNEMQSTPIKILSNVAIPNGTKPVIIPKSPSSWAKDEVDAAITAELVPENLQQNYRLPVSRSDVAQMFINLIEKSSDKNITEIMDEKSATLNADAFTDTNDKVVLEANALGIINGIGNNKFDPNGTLTRAQIAAIINRIARVLNIETEGYPHNFTDVSGHWVDSELGWPSSVGIINGVGDNKFSPNTELTTEQAIVITYRALKVLKQ